MTTRNNFIIATLFVCMFAAFLWDAAVGLETAVLTSSSPASLDADVDPAAALSCTAARIMPMGDSITAGVGSSNDAGYRLPLFHMLRVEGIAFDFVGTQIGGDLITGFDPDHEGYPGEKTNSIRLRSNGMLNDNDPDVILLHAGTNDMNGIKAASTQVEIDAIIDTAVDNMSQILDNVDTYESDNGKTITVFVARIINQACDDSNDKCAKRIQATTDYNVALQAMVDARGDADVTVVDMETGAGIVYDQEPNGDFAAGDELHPSDGGYYKMATVWANDVTNLLPGGCDTAPLIYTTPITETTAGQLYTDTVSASGYPLPTYALTTAPADMNINENSGVISWTPDTNDAGDHTVVVAATNSSGSDVQTYTLTVGVNLAPTITSTPITQTIANTNYQYDVVASGETPLTYRLTTVPTGMSINSSTGLITWYADEAYVGPNGVTVQVDNNVGSDTQSFTLYVNQSPVINSNQGDENVLVGNTFNYQVTANGYPTVTFNLTQQPDDMIINETTGAISWTPTLNDLGLHNVTVKASNTEGDDTQSFALTVVAAPSINSTPVTKTAVSEPYTYTVIAGGSAPFTYSLTEKPDGMSIDGSGEVSWTPAPAQQGTHTVTVQVNNAHGSDTQTYQLTATAAPVITSQPVTLTNAQAAYSYPVIAGGTGPFTYTLITKPIGMQIDTGGEITWNPDLSAVGSHTVTVEVANSNGIDRQSYLLTVVGEPQITSSPVTETAVSTPYSYAVTANGAVPLTYSLTDAPDGMQINPSTGLLTWTPTMTQLGPQPISLQVSNSLGSDTQNFSLTVLAAPSFTSTPGTSVKAGASYSYQATATGYPAPTYSLTTAPAGMSINPTSGLITWTPNTEQVGKTVDVVVSAQNNQGSDVQAFTVTVAGDDFTLFLPLILQNK